MDTLLSALKTKDEDKAHHFFKSEEWGTVEQLVEATSELFHMTWWEILISLVHLCIHMK